MGGSGWPANAVGRDSRSQAGCDARHRNFTSHPGLRWVKARARDLRAAAIFGSGQNACPMDESNGRQQAREIAANVRLPTQK